MGFPPAPNPPFNLSAFSHGNLYSALSNRFLPDAVIQNKHRAVYLANYLTRLEAKLIITEFEYIDAGYLDDYAAYYVKCFESYDRRCKRLHFFREQVTEKKFLRLVQGTASHKDTKKFRESYLGFIVARPLPDAIIGRTVLKTYDDDNGRRQYTCTRDYGANLFGIDLTVRNSLAFQEQDTVMAACATVALWSAFNKTRDLFNSPAPTPAEITRAANRLILNSRSIPSHGLNVQQMTNAIHHIGLEPEVIQVTENTPLISLVYSQLKWGLPVILGIDIEGVGLHALTLVGYSLRQEPVRKYEVLNSEGKSMCAPMVGLRIDRLFAHDDRIGPFVRLDIEENPAPDKKRPCPILLKPKWPTAPVTNQKPKEPKKIKSDAAAKVPSIMYPRNVIVPVYHKIRVTFQDVEKLLFHFTHVLRDIHKPDEVLEWDLHLTTTNEYKEIIKEDESLSQEIKSSVLLRPHPKYFWRAILRISGQQVMELLADATDMSRSFPIYLAIWYNQEDKKILHNYLDSSKFKDASIAVLGDRFVNFIRKSTA